MKKFLFLLFAILLVIPPQDLSAEENKESRKSYKKARKYLKKSDFLRAIPYLKRSLSMDPEHAESAYWLGRSYFETDRVGQSLDYFIRAYNLDMAIEEFPCFFVGFTMILEGELDHLPEGAFYMKGSIDEVIEAGEKMIAEA